MQSNLLKASQVLKAGSANEELEIERRKVKELERTVENERRLRSVMELTHKQKINALEAELQLYKTASQLK